MTNEQLAVMFGEINGGLDHARARALQWLDDRYPDAIEKQKMIMGMSSRNCGALVEYEDLRERLAKYIKHLKGEK